MANFPVLPFCFLPGPVTIEPSPEDRLQRSLLIVGDPPLQHEEYAIIVVIPELDDIDKEEALAEVCTILNRDHNAPVTGRVYSIGIGLVRFESAAIRDHLIETGPHTMDRDEIHMFSVVRHDEGLNMRSPVFEREAWVLMLNFPLDYQTNYYVNKAVSLFGKIELWHNPRLDMTRVLVKVLIKSLRLVPFSLVVTRGANQFGVLGRSWSVPIYVLHGRTVNPQLIGNEDQVPPMNASPHPYTLPYLNLAQQHAHDMQLWQQQNADAAWEAPHGLQADNGDWGEWPYEGESWRAITGYAGNSMLDGVIPDGNVSDDPDTWSPSLSDMEEAADDVVHGRQNGELRFLRAGGENMLLQVDTLPGAQNSSYEVGESSGRLSSLIIVPSSASEAADSIFAHHSHDLVLYGVEEFKQLILFLSNTVYSKVQYLTAGAVEPILPLVLVEEQTMEWMSMFSFEFRDKIFEATVFKLEFGASCLDKAAALALNNLLTPATGSWSDAFKYMYLGDEGELCWAPIDLEQGDSNTSWAEGQSSATIIGLADGPRRPGRPRKTQEAPKVKSTVRYCTRNNNAGYCHQVLADTRRPRKTGKAVAPAVLQIEEMQRIGIEDCQIDPAELTAERLMQEKK
ncbi:hypothetical protein ACQ4PT_026776 [Festuca glaucescens]